MRENSPVRVLLCEMIVFDLGLTAQRNYPS